LDSLRVLATVSNLRSFALFFGSANASPQDYSVAGLS
jgi:hypothetical protein